MKLDDNIMLDRMNGREDPSLWTASSPYGIVCSAHYKATEAGVQILSKGGNAIDAAIATSLALGVVEPAGSGLGGMAMIMIHLAKENNSFILEGPCRAPVNANPEDYIKLASDYMEKHGLEDTKENRERAAGVVRKSGYKSIAVPTNVSTITYALKNYGTMSPEQVLAPAIKQVLISKHFGGWLNQGEMGLRPD
jgi:gamma-glutamyltranspeptidase/glutathione hydrolase